LNYTRERTSLYPIAADVAPTLSTTSLPGAGDPSTKFLDSYCPGDGGLFQDSVPPSARETPADGPPPSHHRRLTGNVRHPR